MINIITICLLGTLLQTTKATDLSQESKTPVFRKSSTSSEVHYLKDNLSAYPHLEDNDLRQQANYTQSHLCAETYRAHWPQCVQGEICATFDGMKFYSQGMLVGPYHVLTIGFSMYKNISFYKRSYRMEDASQPSSSSFGWADTVTFTPIIEHLEPAQALVVMAPESWTKHFYNSISMLILDRPLGQDLGWFGISSVSDTDLMNRELRSFCCPQKLTITKVSKEFFEYDVETTKEQAGAGIWLSSDLKESNTYQIIGTHNYLTLPDGWFFDNDKQYKNTEAERLSEQKVKCIQNWLQQTYNNAHRESLQYFKQVKSDHGKDLNNLALMLELAHLYRKGKGTMQDYEKARFLYLRIIGEKINTKSDVEVKNKAFYQIGQFYYHGSDISKNATLAFGHFKCSALEGYAKAQFMLGNMYKQGQHVTQNNIKAFKWYKAAAIQGHRQAQLNIGNMYHHGIGVNVSYGDAILWYFGAAVQRHSMAQYRLGQMYNQGQGVQSNAAEAIRWYTLAAKQGHIKASEELKKNTQTNIVSGVDFQQTKQDIDKYCLLHQQAEQGDAQAQFDLGVIYYQGKGVSQSFVEAAKWFKTAANQGDTRAQFNLGVMYDQGLGIDKNSKEAFRWYKKAAKQGYLDAQYNLSVMYVEEIAVPRNYQKSYKWLDTAAKQGHEQALVAYHKLADQGGEKIQFNLGIMYFQGQGVPLSYREAFRWFKKAAIQGHQAAQFNLGDMYHHGIGVDVSYGDAILWYFGAAVQKHAMAQYRLGQMYEKGQGVRPNAAEAIRWYTLAARQGHIEASEELKKNTRTNIVSGVDFQQTKQDIDKYRLLHQQAEQGDAQAQFNLGQMYEKGQGVFQDDAESIRWYKAAAKQGNLQAQFNLAVMYVNREDVPQKLTKAFKWFKASAEQGNVWAQFTLGQMYDRSIGVNQDLTEAIKWYKIAAKQGHVVAQYDLGIMYSQGQGVTQDYIEAIKWYKLAAEKGEVRSQCNLGEAYINGQGVPQNDVEAVKWFKAAAEQGYAEAQFNLGLMYGQGQGVPQNDVEAFKWFKVAAEQGYAITQLCLGAMYNQGLGVSQNYQQAFRYLKLAAKNSVNHANFYLGVMYYLGQGLEHNDIDQAIEYLTCFLEKEDRQTNEYKVAQEFLSKIQNEAKADSTHAFNTLTNADLTHTFSILTNVKTMYQNNIYNLDKKHWINAESEGLRLLIGQEIATFSQTKIKNSSALLKQLVINHIVKQSPHAQFKVIEQVYYRILNGD